MYGEQSALVALKKQRDREVWSFTQVTTLTVQLASGLNEAGLEAGTRVLLFAPTTLQLVHRTETLRSTAQAVCSVLAHGSIRGSRA
jgi:non-ribosomal peptide synthetase component E (peptide arylation enzyme)